MAANPPRAPRQGIFSAWRDYFLPPPVEPVEIPVVPQNNKPLTKEETSRLRREQAKAIDKYFDEELDKKNFDELNNKNRSLQWMPDITPQDPLWQRTRAYYAHLLKNERISEVLDDHFEEIQKILINPQAWSNEVQEVRDQQSREYYENLSPGGAFEGQLDNLATKMTMIHFGLPVAPMTLNNIMVLTPDWADSEDDGEDPPPSPPRQQRIIYSEKPLEFLDSYIERAFGYQIIRRPRPSLRGGTGSIEELDPEDIGDLEWEATPTVVQMRGGAGSVEALNSADTCDYEWVSTVTMRGGAGGEPALQGYYLELLGPGPQHTARRTHLVPDEFLTSARNLIGCPEGSDWPFNVDIYRQTDPRKIDIPLQSSFPIVSGEDFHDQWPFIEEIIGKVDHDQLTIIIEGKRFGRELAPQFFEDLVRLAREFPDENRKVSQHCIYSYFGRRQIYPRYFAFKDAVTKLLNIDPTSNWSFIVDVHLQDRILAPIHFDRAHYRNDFLSLRDQYLLGAASANAKVFVRHVSGYAPSQLNIVEPARNDLQIVKLTSQHNNVETYWKIPQNRKLDYCINLLQPAFVRAFLAIFGPDRPYQNVRLVNPQGGGNIQRAIGFGGMEVTRETWQWLVQQIGEQNPPGNDSPTSCNLDLILNALPHNINATEALTLHLIGDDYNQDMVFRRNEYLQIYAYILERLRIRHKQDPDSAFPDGSSIAMWFSAVEREENYPPVIMQVHRQDDDAEQARKLTEAFSSRAQTFNNIWFRPEYQVFTIHDHLEPARVWQWNTSDEQHNTSLANFRDNIKEMYDDWDPTLDGNFVLVQTRANRMFAIDRRTTEDYWRRYVFDWITETDIYIQRRGVRPFMQPDTNSWGYRHTRQMPVEPPADPNPPPVPPVVDPSQQSRLNKTRLITPVAQKAVTPKWQDWMTDQHFKNDLQRRSYIQDQSVIEPGLDPSAPTYGPSKELVLGVSLSTPSTYIQRLTPTDIVALAEENQTLRNGVLNRIHICPICNVTMTGYENAEIQKHFELHLRQLQKEGQCPICERECWSTMSMEEKKKHLEMHQAEADTEMIRNFWNRIACPVCDAKLSGFTAEQVLMHMADHLPGIVEFCDRCGLRTAICAYPELVHHRYTCLDKPERGPLDPEPAFCGDCGQNRTAEDEEDRGQHVINCTAKNRRNQEKKFCTKCGIDKSAWSKDEITEHDDRCTSPQGVSRMYCLRCGTKLLGLSSDQLNDHHVYCTVRTKKPEDIHRRIEDLKARVTENNRVAAKNAASLAQVTQREIELAEYERKIAEREACLPPGDRPIVPWAADTSDLGKCPWSLKGCNYYTVGKSREDIFKHMSSHFDPKFALPFNCPFAGCGKSVGFPGSDLENNLNITEHYRHRHEEGISDVRSVTKPSRTRPSRDPKKLEILMEHFKRANQMIALTAERHATPIPELEEAQKRFAAKGATSGAGTGAGTGAGAGSFHGSNLKTGYLYQPSWLSPDDSGDESLSPSIEDDSDIPLEDLFEPSFKLPSSIVARPPRSPGQPPLLPYSPAKRRASAAIPAEQLEPTSARPFKRVKHVQIREPSPDPEAKRKRESKIMTRKSRRTGSSSTKAKKAAADWMKQWDDLMEEVEREQEDAGFNIDDDDDIDDEYRKMKDSLAEQSQHTYERLVELSEQEEDEEIHIKLLELAAREKGEGVEDEEEGEEDEEYAEDTEDIEVEMTLAEQQIERDLAELQEAEMQYEREFGEEERRLQILQGEEERERREREEEKERRGGRESDVEDFEEKRIIMKRRRQVKLQRQREREEEE